jgi:ankyrin repeat protein
MSATRLGIWGLAALCAAAVVRAAEPDTRVLDAVKSGNTSAIQLLLRTHADVNAVETDGTTALMWAVRANDVDLVRQLLKAGANVRAANRYGVTPLTLAAANGNAAVTKLLLDGGADANTAYPEGETVLMTAARTGTPEVLQLLLDHGAAVNAKESQMGETALMWAAAENHPDAVAVLVKRSANLNAQSTLLKFPKYLFNGSTMVSTPLPRGGMTALLLAAREGAADGVRALVEAGADLNVADPDGTTPLVMAIINRHNDIAKFLIEHGANPNIADSTGMTALYAAVDLRTLGPLINRPTPKPTSTVDNAEIVDTLLKHGANPNAQQRLPILPRYHNAGDKQLAEGATPLMRAARALDLPVMKLLLDHGANPNLSTKNFMTPLIFAASGGGRGRVEEADVIAALTLCLDHGADINAFDNTGATALFAAVPRGDSIVKFLVERGADLDVKDKQGRTPLDVAMGITNAFNDPRGAPRSAARESTVALLKRLMEQKDTSSASNR